VAEILERLEVEAREAGAAVEQHERSPLAGAGHPVPDGAAGNRESRLSGRQAGVRGRRVELRNRCLLAAGQRGDGGGDQQGGSDQWVEVSFASCLISGTSSTRIPVAGCSTAYTSAVTICWRLIRPRRRAPARVAGNRPSTAYIGKSR